MGIIPEENEEKWGTGKYEEDLRQDDDLR